MAQTQFLDSLFPTNHVIITLTLYLDYLLFRYFQYAFHLDEFSIWRKSTEEIYTMLYVMGRTLSICTHILFVGVNKKHIIWK